MKEVRTKVRAFILAITGFIVTLLVLRFILLLIGANQQHTLVGLVINITNIFVDPLFTVPAGNFPAGIDANTLISVVIYAVLGILVSEIVTGFLYDDPMMIFVQVLDALFKVVEFFLITRIVLKLFGIASASGIFVAQVYTYTEWSQGIFPSPPFLSGTLEISTIIVLVIVVVIDIATEGVIASIRTRVAEREKEKQSAPPPAETKVVVQTEPAVGQMPSQQNITINVPMPPPVQQPAPEKQVVNVFDPSGPPAALPGEKEG